MSMIMAKNMRQVITFVLRAAVHYLSESQSSSVQGRITSFFCSRLTRICTYSISGAFLRHEGYEKMLRHMQNYHHENKLPPSYFINVETIMEREDFIRGTYSSHSAIIFVDDLYPEKDSIRILPQNTYMSVASDSIALESTYARHLHEEIKRNGMMPCGDYLCEGLTQFPVHQADQLIYKIQLPVQRSNGRSTL